MRKKVSVLFVSLIFSLFFYGSAYGEELIQPFGTLNWEDSFFDIVEKLSAIDGIDTIALNVEYGKNINVKNLNKNEITKLLGEFIEKHFARDYAEGRKPPNVETFKNHEGKVCSYLNWSIGKLVASPILIKGVPFELKAEFETSPGLAIVYPDKVMKETKHDTYFPLVLTKVTLSSSSSLIGAHSKEIDEILLKKYSKYNTDVIDISPYGKSIMGEVRDSKGNCLKIPSLNIPYEYQFSYISQGFIESLKTKYTEHLADLEDHELKTKQDHSSDL